MEDSAGFISNASLALKYVSSLFDSKASRGRFMEGVVINASEILDYTNKSEPIYECNKFSKLLNGGLYVTLNIDKDAKVDEIKKSIEKASTLVSSFKPVKKITICGECGFKDEPFEDKCPKCKSPYIV